MLFDDNDDDDDDEDDDDDDDDDHYGHDDEENDDEGYGDVDDDDDAGDDDDDQHHHDDDDIVSAKNRYCEVPKFSKLSHRPKLLKEVDRLRVPLRELRAAAGDFSEDDDPSEKNHACLTACPCCCPPQLQHRLLEAAPLVAPSCPASC
jgi:hypothetical protein